jgi:hypothetical protein
MNKDLLETYRSMGNMPDWIYYQLNGKSAQENFVETMRKNQEEYKRNLREQQQEEALNKYIDKLLEDKLDKALDKALDDCFRNLYI